MSAFVYILLAASA